MLDLASSVEWQSARMAGVPRVHGDRGPGMSRSYVALLRGIGPANPLLRNTELRAVVEGLGHRNVRTVLSSGNVLFETSEAGSAALEASIEDAMRRHLGAPCVTIVRSRRRMERLVALDVHDDAAGRQGIVTFLQAPPRHGPELPHGQDGWTVLALHDGALLSVPDEAGSPAVLRWIERAYGPANTTRSWRSVRRITTRLGQEA